MATEPIRAYRAACPNCGAPVDFVSAASASAVCSFCRSTLVRDGEALRRIGVSAELFDDHTPLQLGAAGKLDGENFTLIGRLQYGYAEGSWNEWHALFDNGRSGWLSEDNGAYVFAFDANPPGDAPRPERMRAGEKRRIAGRDWDVASLVQARLIAAQGELPSPPRLEGEFPIADLRNAVGEVATIDGSDPVAIHWSVGRSVLLADLALQGLREVSEKTIASRGVECPNCGTALEPKLATTQALACHQCNTVVDISQGVGADLAHYAQNNSGAGGLEPQIPLGKVGRLAMGGAPVGWQVVGYLERCDLPEPGDDDEQTFWREYLLYEPKQGFAFLVDAEDGWSWVRPITGAPTQKGNVATWRGIQHQLKYTYNAKVTWVQGEFYWRLQREETARVSDYLGTGSNGSKRLSREETRREGAQEVTWSAGEAMPASQVADAFDLTPEQRGALSRDVTPTSGQGKKAMSWAIILAIVAIVILIDMLPSCSSNDCSETRAAFGDTSPEYRQCLNSRSSGTRTSGGSFGGYSSGGGGHK